MAPAITAHNLGKRFLHHGDLGPRTFRHMVEQAWKRKRAATPFWALRGLNATVDPGEVVGVIGRNGSGKSTLLRIIGGVMMPDEGSLTVEAPVHGLLDLNTGMHPDLTGRENIMIGGVLAGLRRDEVKSRFDEIIAFSELEKHIDEPFRTYSDGMKLRLGFAIAVHVSPRILLIDEVLSVGDAAFQAKCLDRLRTIRSNGCAIVVISHDLVQLRHFCDRVIWLRDGAVVTTGKPAEVIDAYEASLTHAMMRHSDVTRPSDSTLYGTTLQMGTNRFGTLEAEITQVRLQTGAVEDIPTISTGGPLTIHANLAATRPIAAHVSAAIAGSDGATCFESNTQVDGMEGLVSLTSRHALKVVFERCDLAPGDYTISLGLWDADWEGAYDFHVHAYPLRVTGPAAVSGPFSPPRHWKIDPSPD